MSKRVRENLCYKNPYYKQNNIKQIKIYKTDFITINIIFRDNVKITHEGYK